MRHSLRGAGGVLGCWLLMLAGAGHSAEPAAPSAADVRAIALEGYVFGYPLVLMDISRQVMTAVDKPDAGAAPLGQFNNATQFPDPDFTAVVSPNADTLYSFAWLVDLSQQPYALSLPDTGKRYYLLQMLDAWTNVFANPGTRTTGNGAGTFAIVGPRFQGTLPANVKELRSPTDLVWIIGRTQTNGPADYAAVRELKSKYKLQPLSSLGTDYQPPEQVPVDSSVDRKTPPVVQAAQLNPEQFFARLAALMQANPPAKADQPVIDRLARIGVVPGQKFDAGKLAPAARAALEQGVADARQLMLDDAKSPTRVPLVHGWAIGLKYGIYGTNYRMRAVTALAGLGANLAQDAVYPMASIDGDGNPLTGERKYTLHFAANKLPPVNAFWSLTMYNADRFFVKNPLNRYALGDRDKLQFNKDGSLTLLLQHQSPGKDRESNWLPAPDGPFNLIMRLYWPKPEVLDGSWTPPSVKRGG